MAVKVARVIRFPHSGTLDDLWCAYQRHAQAQIDNPVLGTDREHVQATLRAYQRFADAYLTECRRHG